MKSLSPHARTWRDLQPKPVAWWRDPAFKYHCAASHNDSSAFRERQQQRAREATQSEIRG